MKAFYMLMAIPVIAFAGDKHVPEKPTPTPSSHAFATAEASADSVNEASLQASNSVKSYAFGTGAPIPMVSAPRCWVPGKGFKRGQTFAFGLYAHTLVPIRDEQCMKDLEAEREFELHRIQLEIQLEQIKKQRIEAEDVRTQKLKK